MYIRRIAGAPRRPERPSLWRKLPTEFGVADEWVMSTVDAKVFKKYSQMKLQMKREALEKLNRHANESGKVLPQ